ncbi:MAG: threonylcarbamoyl-AMP synthase [Rhodobacteraceae bacterium]|nr:threonylcarbamoyl-AMP synthase [Paracoccaceae bacterium]
MEGDVTATPDTSAQSATATERLSPDHTGIARAVEIWRAGGRVAFPTETVYGLGADARQGRAVAGIYAAKGRPAFNPLIVHVAGLAQARDLALFDPQAEALARAFWPGPLSLVLPRRAGCGLSDLVSAGLPDVALRVPAHPLARQLLAAFGGPVAAPSANPSGRISPTTAAHVLTALEGRIEAVIDGGPCSCGLESTILGRGPDGRWRILRPGAVTDADVARILGYLPAPQEGTAPDAPRAPGMMASHYAPEARLRLGVGMARSGAVHLGFGPPVPGEALNLSPSADLAEAAANLFAMLHEADRRARTAGGIISVAPIPEMGLGLAINDRLRRAAAPR